MWQQTYIIINIQQHSGNNIRHINGRNPYMGPNNKWHANWTRQPYYQSKKTHIQKIVVTLIYYARPDYPIIMVALVSIDANQYNINDTTTQYIKQLLGYCAIHPDSTIRHKESYMVLRINSDGSYLS